MEITIEITTYCPHECDYCSNHSGPQGRPLEYETIFNFLHKTNAEHKIDRINISGGEPLSHPEFYWIFLACKLFTKNVWVYSNVIEQLMYNTDIIKEVKVEANVCLVPGRDVYIPKNASKTHLLQLVPQGKAENMKPGKYHVSSNIKVENDCDHDCSTCNHSLLQADGKVVTAPCKKEY